MTLEENLVVYPIIAKIQIVKMPGSGGQRFTYKLLKVYRGEPPILAGSRQKTAATSCDANLKRKQKWIVFLERVDEVLNFGLCGPNFIFDNKIRDVERLLKDSEV